MQIEKCEKGDLLVLAVNGVLDNDSSVHFMNEIESCKRQGWHRIVVDLGGVSYLSSAGIAAMVTAKKQFQQLSGLFGIFNPTSQVATVLEQVRLLETLSCDPRTAQEAQSTGPLTMVLSSSTRLVQGEGFEMEIYPLGNPPPLTCRLVGDPQSLFESNSPPTYPVSFDSQSFGIGMGWLGNDALRRNVPVGEVISIAGAVAQSAHVNGGLPDYSVVSEDFTPTARLLYGIQWSGEFPTLIRFEPNQRGTNIGLSKLVRQAMRETNNVAAGFVILADCAGLVGAQVRRIPDWSTENASDIFQVPKVREWLSFSAERLHRHSLALITGVAQMGEWDEASAVRPFLRPIDQEQECFGHFHSVVFPYRPLKKRTLRLQHEVAKLFDSGALEDVLHLLRDDRPIIGSGESALLSGACWIGAIDRVDPAEEAK